MHSQRRYLDRGAALNVYYEACDWWAGRFFEGVAAYFGGAGSSPGASGWGQGCEGTRQGCIELGGEQELDWGQVLRPL